MSNTTPTPDQPRSPLRYPGGKSKALKYILPQVPEIVKEFREPFVGGGSVFLAMRYKFGAQAVYWINDLNTELAVFWEMARDRLPELVKAVTHIKRTQSDGRALFNRLREQDGHDLNEIDRAARFFVLNRITFSGTIESGGFSKTAFEKRFTESSIDRLANLAGWLDDTIISDQDYATLLDKPGEHVFIFLDPPYLKSVKSKLYGKRGDLHTAFDHARFAEQMRSCAHKWLITYDDSPEIRALFRFANIIEWQLQYGMNNVGSTNAAAGAELFIRNY